MLALGVRGGACVSAGRFGLIMAGCSSSETHQRTSKCRPLLPSACAAAPDKVDDPGAVRVEVKGSVHVTKMWQLNTRARGMRAHWGAYLSMNC